MIHSKLLNKNLDKNQLKYVNHQHKSSLKYIKIIHYIFVTKKKTYFRYCARNKINLMYEKISTLELVHFPREPISM